MVLPATSSSEFDMFVRSAD